MTYQARPTRNECALSSLSFSLHAACMMLPRGLKVGVNFLGKYSSLHFINLKIIHLKRIRDEVSLNCSFKVM